MPRIVYLSWPAKEVTGGIKMVFRHVEALREVGFAACVATADAEPPPWFATTAPLLPLTDLCPDTDILVFPENHNALLEQFASWHSLKVIACHSWSLACIGLSTRRSYADFGAHDLICPGELTASYYRRRCPAARLFVVPNYVDRGLFRPQTNKRLQIAFNPSKRQLEAKFLRDLLQAEHPQWSAIPWVRLAGLSEAEVARVLGESALYLSLGRFEALPLSLLEALACGCICAGFTGYGGREMATAANGFWAAEDDCLDCADQLARAVRLAREGGDRLQEMCRAAVSSAALYNRERFAAALTRCWKTLAPEAQSTPPQLL